LFVDNQIFSDLLGLYFPYFETPGLLAEMWRPLNYHLGFFLKVFDIVVNVKVFKIYSAINLILFGVSTIRCYLII